MGGVILPHKDTQGWCRHRPGSTFSLLVSSAPRAPQGAPAPTPYATGWGGPGALGRPLSPLHPNPISRVVVAAVGGGTGDGARPPNGGFSQKIQVVAARAAAGAALGPGLRSWRVEEPHVFVPGVHVPERVGTGSEPSDGQWWHRHRRHCHHRHHRQSTHVSPHHHPPRSGADLHGVGFLLLPDDVDAGSPQQARGATGTGRRTRR